MNVTQYVYLIFRQSVNLSWLLVGSLLVNLTIGLSPARAQSSSGGIHLTFPVSRMIVQRDNNNQATVQLAGSYDAPVDRVEARAVTRVAGQGTTTSWFPLTPAQGQFSGSLVILGGWYQLEVRAFKGGVQVGSDVLDRFGVGEVFAIVGHSDAQGSSCYLNGTDYCPSLDGASDDRVTAVGLDQSSPEFYTYLNTADTRYLPGLAFRQLTTFGGMSPFAKMAWFWGHMGDVLVKRINVPVLLYNAGFGGSNMEQTYNAAYDIPFQHSFIRYDLRMPYANIRNLMNLYVPTTGIRAVLLNHGANDRTSSTNDIVRWHYGVIDKVRQEFNLPNLSWIVALASYSSGVYENVRQAQYQTITRAGYKTYQGPDMDNINSLADMPDGGHYSPAGQVKAGEAWANAITDAYLQNIQPYQAQPQPLNTIACADAQRLTLSAPSGYEYMWNTGSADRSLTVGAGQYSLRIRAPQKTVFFPPAVFVPTTINSATYGCSPAPVGQAQPPVQVSQLTTLSGQVGQPVNYVIPAGAFRDPANSALTYSYRNLPAGLSGAGLTVSGTPVGAGSGQFTVIVTNSADMSLSVQVNYGITAQVTTPSTGALALVAPLYNCSTGAITFQTSGGNGTPIEFKSSGITDWTSNPNQFLDRDARTAGDTPPFQLNARQSGQVVTYTWSRQNFCSGTTAPPVSTTTAPPVSTTTAPPASTTTAPATGVLALVAPLYNCSTGAITFQTSGGNGTFIEYSSPGITDWTSNPNQFLDRDARTSGDTPPFQLYARQSGRVVSYTWSRQNFCSGTTAPPVSTTTAPPVSTTTAPPVSTTTAPPASTTTAPATGVLALVAPLYNCSTGAITFQTSGGNGTFIEYSSPGITDWTSNPNQFLDRDARTSGDTPPFQLYARQSGRVVSYTWSRQNFCSGTTAPPVSTTTAPPVSTTTAPPVSTTTAPPASTTTAPSTGALALVAPLYNCSTGAITFRTSGGNGTFIEYRAVGITDWTSNPNQFLDRDARTSGDTPPFQLNARQSGQVVTYTWSRQTFCSGTTAPPVSTTTAPPVSTTTAPPVSTTTASSTGALALVAPLYNCSTGAITFRTSGGNGTFIEYRAVGISDWTSNPNQFLDRDARTSGDTPPFQLYARQSGQVVSYTWSRQATCGSGARVAAQESGPLLSVQVLGNPVTGSTVDVLVTGATGHALTLEVIDFMGHLINRQQIESAQAEERARLDVGHSPGLLLLRATTPTQQQTLKLLKP